MKFLTGLLFALATEAAALATAGSATSRRDQASGKLSNVIITSNKLHRSFLLFVPSSYDPKTPISLILSYHGGNKSAKDQLELDGFTDATANSNSIVIYPQGIDNFWQGVPGVTVNDVQFTADILDHVQREYTIDTARIYAAGKSDGGGFCNVLACDARLSTRIAAFAPVSGAFYVDDDAHRPCRPDTVELRCSPGRREIPLLEFHGGNDTVISYEGGERKGECLPAIPHFVRQWAVRDGLGPHNTSEKLADSTTLYKFGEGARAGLVEHIFDSVIGHDWPSTVPNADNSKDGHHVASFNATPIILDFFRKHALPEH